jgi:FkbM family methyltransferase
MIRKIKNTILFLYSYFFSFEIFDKLHQLLFYLSISGRGYCNYGSFYRTGENYIFSLLRKNQYKNFIDIGCHHGNFSRKLLEIQGSNVIAFEPLKSNYLKLINLNKKYPKKFKIFNFALGNENKKIQIYFQNIGSQLATTKKIFKKSKKQTVLMKKLDSFCKKITDKTIDYIKIDAEGSEYEILLGSQNFLKLKKVKIIQIEFNFYNLHSNINLKKISDYLADFDVYIIKPFSRGLKKINPSLPEYNIFHLSNFCFIKKSLDFKL